MKVICIVIAVIYAIGAIVFWFGIRHAAYLKDDDEPDDGKDTDTEKTE